MLRFLPCLCLTSALIACSAETSPTEPVETATPDVVTPSETAQAISLSEQWVLDGFSSPESVIPTRSGQDYYVSAVGGDGTAKDNNGAIAIVSQGGTALNRSWVTGTDELPLHAPKGMALVASEKGETLVVADIDTVVLILTEEGRIAKRIPVEGARFLNDVAAGPGETALISDSANARIYWLEENVPTVWLEDERLGGVNGLHLDGDRLLVTTMSAGELLSIDMDTKEITVLAGGMENADGIGLRSDGSYIISSWPGQLWHVREGETPTLLQDTSGDTPTFMNDLLLVDDQTLVTPNWQPGTVREYRVE